MVVLDMRPCDTCESQYVDEIDKLIMAGWKKKEIYRYLKGKYPDADNLPSYDSICNHATNHVEEVIERAVQSNRTRQRKIRAEIKSSISSAEQLRSNLAYISISLRNLWEGMEFGAGYNKDMYKDLSRLIASANKTIELILKFKNEIEGAVTSEDEIFDRLMYAIAVLQPDTIDMIRLRWDEYVQ